MEKELIIEVSHKTFDYTAVISEDKLQALLVLFENGTPVDVLRSFFQAESRPLLEAGNGDPDFSLVLDGINDALSWEELAEAFAD